MVVVLVLKLKVPMKTVVGVAEEVATVVFVIMIVELVFEGLALLMLQPKIEVLASIHIMHKLLEKYKISAAYCLNH